jgi:cellulose synthase/poly-beta-1,6-N-acetylglucosamine synthase-like glycosyltransferase
MSSTILRLVNSDPVREPPDARLIDTYGAQRALRDRVLPWRRVGCATVIVVASAASYYRNRQQLETLFGQTQMALAPEKALLAALLQQRRGTLAKLAETRVAPHESCRTFWSTRRAILGLACMVAIVAVIIWQPIWAMAIASGWAIFSLVLTTALRIAASMAQGLSRIRKADPVPETTGAVPMLVRLPKVSLLVPLFREREIADHLITRLERLDYPRKLLDICLIAEQNDTITQATLTQAGIPSWMRVVVVPPGKLQTKPRAMNYALDFARGSIIGVYDAEDEPEPDQINAIVARFQRAPADVACLQGVLDFYNARQNWLSRCFSIDYATWFRLILPGLAQLGLVVPLGGTTVFFRRAALEALGGWDAHNVTEDADLGVRLARRGFRTELIPTVTREEANCHVWPWVKQRSRWLKGYAITYAVHMRAPLHLLSDLGMWRFFGFQILLLGTLSQFILAPVLWSFWMVALGLHHPLEALVSADMLLGVAGLFLVAEFTNIVLGSVAVSGSRHRWLIPWVPTLHFYWPLGAIASYKALWEVVTRPFFWDKTAHGLSDPVSSSGSTGSG